MKSEIPLEFKYLPYTRRNLISHKRAIRNHVQKVLFISILCSILDGKNIFKDILLIAHTLKVCIEKSIPAQEY
jgi:hypothetical protein